MAQGNALFIIIILRLDMSRAASDKKKQVFGDLQNEEVLLGMKLVEPAHHIVTYKKINKIKKIKNN